jgi:hypothetical protein
MAAVPEALAVLRGAAVLPDDGVVDGPAGPAIPDHHGLALVGDSERGDVPGAETGPGESFAGGGELRLPDLIRVVLHPSGPGKDLLKLPLGDGPDGAGLVEDDGARAGGALVERKDMSHGEVLPGGTLQRGTV